MRIARVLLVLSALALGLYGIDRSLWTDEAWVANSVMSQSLSGMFYYPSWLQTTPPLFLLLTRGAIDLLGPSSVAFRIVPLVLELVAIGGMATLCGRLMSAPLALIASALLTFYPAAIEYSRTSKQYSGEMAASTLILLCAALYLRNPDRQKFWWLTGAFVITSPLAWSNAFLLPGIAAAVWAKGGWRRAGSFLLIATGVMAGLYVSFARPNISSELHGFWAVSAQRITPGLMLAIVFCVAAGLRFLWTRDWMQFVALLPCLLLAAADALGRYPVSQRTRLFVIPCFLVLAATNADDLIRWFARGRALPRWTGALAALIAIAIGVNAAWKQVRNHENQPIEDFAGAVRDLQHSVAPSDTLLVHASVIEGFKLYAAIDGWRNPPVRYGDTGWPCCQRGRTDQQGSSTVEAVTADLTRMIPAGFPGRIWLFSSGRHTHWLWVGQDEGSLWRSLLLERGCTPGTSRDFKNLLIGEVDCVKAR